MVERQGLKHEACSRETMQRPPGALINVQEILWSRCDLGFPLLCLRCIVSSTLLIISLRMHLFQDHLLLLKLQILLFIQDLKITPKKA